MPHSERTIAAIATPTGVGALSVVRMSGPAAQDILYACTGRRLKPRHASLVRVRDASGAVVDECIATLFAAPASFTGEDVAELTCHGGLLVTQRVLERLFACGASPAEPGEFSRRAFENGRLDLTQAEAVMDIIRAGSDLALRAAQGQLQGAISRPVQSVADTILHVAAHVEAYIDFPEEDIAPQSMQEMAARLAAAADSLRKLLHTADAGRLLREGVRTVILGAPNAGKSSLLNHLLGYDRAIVSPTAGTTRDTVEESATLGGLLLRLIDTAGLRESTDAIEQSGMERTIRAWKEADVVLEVADASCPPQPLPSIETHAPIIRLLNKSDLPEHPAWHGAQGIRLSCRTGDGFTELEQALTSLFFTRGGELDTSAAINTRHRYALQQALEALSAAQQGLAAGIELELVAVDLRTALDALGSIIGRVDVEDILTQVFSTFCLGK